jgi:hypothetical protein
MGLVRDLVLMLQRCSGGACPPKKSHHWFLMAQTDRRYDVFKQKYLERQAGFPLQTCD